MSTRAQVKIIHEHEKGNDEVTLYHHCDGYPQYMIHVIKEAINVTTLPLVGSIPVNMVYRLYHVDDGFEVEPDHDLYPDIEYYYKLYFIGTEDEYENELSKWEVEILTPKPGFLETATVEEIKVLKGMPLDKILDVFFPEGSFQKNPTEDNMDISFQRTPLDKIPIY